MFYNPVGLVLLMLNTYKVSKTLQEIRQTLNKKS